jgi:hypothetical protein
MKKLALLWGAVLLLTTSFVWAQSAPDSVCEVNTTVVKNAKAFEAARKKHNEFHKAEKDKNAIHVWEIISGPHTGAYLTTVCGLTWKSMDGHEDMDARDMADMEKNINLQSEHNMTSYYVLQPELGVPPGMDPNMKMLSVGTIFVKPAHYAQFIESLKRIKAALDQTNYPGKRGTWYALANGGVGPQFVVSTPRDGWGDFQGPDVKLSDILKKVYGDDDKTMEKYRESIDHYVSEILVLRKDLSYIPAM